MLVFSGNESNNGWLLPEDAYPPLEDGSPMPPEKRLRVDLKLKTIQHLIPTVPGDYIDTDGKHWNLAEDGGWTDHHGEKRDSRYTPIIGLMIEAKGAFQKVD